jgi:hypothetical protein
MRTGSKVALAASTSAALLMLIALIPGTARAAAILVQDIDQPARAPFVTTVTLNAVTNFNFTPVSIPTGQRLVIDYVSITGAATTTSGPYVIPIVIINAGLNGQGSNSFYFAPPQNPYESSQFYMVQPTTIYADTLAVGPAYAGYPPNFDTFNVVISGHLISNP